MAKEIMKLDLKSIRQIGGSSNSYRRRVKANKVQEAEENEYNMFKTIDNLTLQ